MMASTSSITFNGSGVRDAAFVQVRVLGLRPGDTSGWGLFRVPGSILLVLHRMHSTLQEVAESQSNRSTARVFID